MLGNLDFIWKAVGEARGFKVGDTRFASCVRDHRSCGGESPAAGGRGEGAVPAPDPLSDLRGGRDPGERPAARADATA